MSRIQIKTLGQFRIEQDGQERLDLPTQPVRCAIFLYLALKREVDREELISLIWPGRNSEKTRHSLSQTLYELRRQLGNVFSTTGPNRVEISSDVRVDVLKFKKALQDGHDSEALEIYTGPFLKGQHFRVSDEFDDWADHQRFELERQYRILCRRLSNTFLDQKDYHKALEIAGRWVSMDPLEDEAQHLYIRLLAHTGRRSEALQQYSRYKELIKKELDVEPLDETKMLIRQVREESTNKHTPNPGSLPSLRPPSTPGNQAPGDERSAIETDEHELAATGSGHLSIYKWRNLSAVAGVLAILIATGLFLWLLIPVSQEVHSAEPEPEAAGIAVLPFVNMGPDPDQEYFSDGITEDLLTALTKLESMRVISRTSVMRYKGSDLSLPEIASELNVEYILEGSVRRDHSNVRITAQLIEVADDKHLWAETFDRELTDIFEIKSEIAHRIADALQQRLTSVDRARIAHGGTDNLTAYDFFLRGREYLNRPGEADQRKYVLAENFFRQALDSDPGFARGYAALSEVYRRHVLIPVTVRRDSMLVFSSFATKLDPELAEAAVESGYAHMFSWEHDQARDEFHRALVLDPNQTDAMSGLARLSVLNGDLAGAIRWEQRALAIDPHAAGRLYNLGIYMFHIGDLEGAQSAFEQVLTLVPDHPEASYLLAQIHLIRGDEHLAEARMQALNDFASDLETVRVMQAKYHAQLGRFEVAMNYLRTSRAAEFGAVRLYYAFIAQQLGHTGMAEELMLQPAAMFSEWERSGYPVPPRGKLYLHLLQNEPDSALYVLQNYWLTGLNWLEDPPEIGIYWINRQPKAGPLLDDPRFEAILREIRRTFDGMREQMASDYPPR